MKLSDTNGSSNDIFISPFIIERMKEFKLIFPVFLGS